MTVVHKANVLRLTDGLFLKTAQSLSKKYPGIIYEEMLVDSCAMQLIKKPESFDVIVTTNMFGDILSDEIAGIDRRVGSCRVGKHRGELKHFLNRSMDQHQNTRGKISPIRWLVFYRLVLCWSI